MTELGHNTPLGRGGSLLTVVIILTRLVRPANVSRADGRAGWASVVVVVVVVVVGSFCLFLLLHRGRNRGRKAGNHTNRSGLRTRNNSSLYLYLYLYLCLYLYLDLYFLYLYLQKRTGVDSGPATVPYFLGMLPTLGSLVINTIAFLILAVQKYVSQIIPDINLILQTNDKVLEPKLSLICLQLVPRCRLQCHNSHSSSNLE